MDGPEVLKALRQIRGRYDDWIRRHVEEHGAALLGRCKESTAEMRAAFPELVEVRGHVWVMGWGRRGHIWLSTRDGMIIDPTASQFPNIMCYEAWRPGDLVRAGTCMDCGEEIWVAVDTLDGPPPERSFCSEDCERSFIAHLGAPR